MNSETITPLKIIEDWIFSLEPEIRLRILAIVKKFHPDQSIKESSNSEAFICYIKEENLELNEMIHRTAKAIRLIDFAIYDRKTECNWIPTLDPDMNCKNFNLEDENVKKALDWIFTAGSLQKDSWFKAGKSWNNLLKNYFINTSISNMYFSESRTYTKA